MNLIKMSLMEFFFVGVGRDNKQVNIPKRRQKHVIPDGNEVYEEYKG